MKINCDEVESDCLFVIQDTGGVKLHIVENYSEPKERHAIILLKRDKIKALVSELNKLMGGLDE